MKLKAPENIVVWRGDRYAEWDRTWRIYFINMKNLEGYNGRFWAFFATERKNFSTFEIKAQLIRSGCYGMTHEYREDFSKMPEQFQNFVMFYYKNVFGESAS